MSWDLPEARTGPFWRRYLRDGSRIIHLSRRHYSRRRSGGDLGHTFTQRKGDRPPHRNVLPCATRPNHCPYCFVAKAALKASRGASKPYLPMTWEGNGGDGGIRTLDTLLGYAHLANECLQPLGHVSNTANRDAESPSRRWRNRREQGPFVKVQIHPLRSPTNTGLSVGS